MWSSYEMAIFPSAVKVTMTEGIMFGTDVAYIYIFTYIFMHTYVYVGFLRDGHVSFAVQGHND